MVQANTLFKFDFDGDQGEYIRVNSISSELAETLKENGAEKVEFKRFLEVVK